MEINILSTRKQEKIAIPGRTIKNIIIKKPNSLNPIYFFWLARFAKVCNVLHVTGRVGGLKGLFGLNIALFFAIVKLPAGPKIIVSLDRKSVFDWPFSFADYIVGKNISKEETKKVYMKAFIDGGAGHPDFIYNLPLQRQRVNWLKKNRTGKTLEIGCATGYIINYVGGGTGLDLDKFRLGIAKNRYPHCKFVYADATKMPFKNKEFDTVLIPEILEHVPFKVAQEIVNECERVGKKLLITVPNADKKHYNKHLVENPEHLWLPTKQHMFKLLGNNIKVGHSINNDFMFITKIC